MERSRGKVRGDVAHERLLALGFTRSEHTTRRAVAAVKKSYRLATPRFNLAAAGEAVKALPDVFKREHVDTPWTSIAGLRSVVVNEYFESTRA